MRYFPKLALWLLVVTAIQPAAAIASSPAKISDRSIELGELGQQLAAAGNVQAALPIFDRAIQAAKKIEDRTAKIYAFSDIAFKLAEAKQTQKSQQVFESALQLTKSSDNDFNLYYKEPALRDIVIDMAKAGFTDQALQVTKTITSNFHQAEALSAIAHILIDQGQLEPGKKLLSQALTKARGISGDYTYESNGSCGNDKFDVMSKIAATLSLSSQVDTALKLAEEISNCSAASGESGQDYQTWAFLGILANLQNVEQVKQEWESAKKFKAAKDAEIWSAIAIRLIDLGEIPLAEKVAAQLAADIPTIKVIDSGSAARYFGTKESELRLIADRFATAGKFASALQVAQTIYEPTPQDIKTNERYSLPSTKSLALVAIAQEYAKASQAEAGLKLVSGLPDPYSKALGNLAIAKELQAQGKTDPAETVLSQVLQLPSIPPADDYNKNSLFGDIAAGFVSVGKLERGLEIAQSLKDENYRESAIAKIASLLAETGKFEPAAAAFKKLTSPGTKEDVADTMVAKLIEFERLDEALTWTQKLEGYRKDSALASVTAAFAKQGNSNQAVKIAQTISDPYQQAQALSDIAAILAEK